ncbi:MAG TPA: hypothetical protein VLX09_24230 [Stellaceae bacterium]|nr:hypothetical protein [Stellaceae bacterium]
MADEKVVLIRGGLAPQKRTSEPHLFMDVAQAQGTVAFLDITSLKQDDFLAVLSRNPVTAIIDIRSRPVFQKPNFRHTQVADYLLSHRITYLDLTSYSARNLFAEAHVSLLASQPHQMLGKVAQILDSGMTLIICDGADFQSATMHDLRRLLSHHASFKAEIHPRSLKR